MRATTVRNTFRVVAVLGLFIRAHAASAQAVQGVVIDNRNASGVSAATVRVVEGEKAGGGTETDNQGRFLLRLPGAGVYRLEVTRLGYEKTRSQTFEVLGGDTVTVEFRVAPDAVLLDPMTVTARSTRGRDRFEARMKEWGKGVYLTPDQIDSMKLRTPTDVFREMPKVKMTWEWGERSDGSRGQMPTILSQMGTGCILYMLNGVFVQPPPWATDRPARGAPRQAPGAALSRAVWSSYQLGHLLPEEVAAVEAYRSVAEVPPELRRFTHITRKRGLPLTNCGLVVFWTKAVW